jgi:uncharacterized membrane protein YciS (DUF1049 family)
MNSEFLLQLSIIVGIVGNIIGISIGVLIVAKYFLVTDKRLKALEKKVGVTNNLKIQK